MEQVAHWTNNSVANFVYGISSTFVAQLETKMEEEKISRSQLAARLKRTTGRVSQVFNDPGNLSLRVIVEYARELGLKVSIVAYSDGDPNNERGPVNPEVFVKCWEKQNCPANLFEVENVGTASASAQSITTAVAIAENYFGNFSYIPLPKAGEVVTYSAVGTAIALDSSPSYYSLQKPLNSGPVGERGGKVA